MIIIDHDHPRYREKWRKLGGNRYNGAFYYSKEIRKYFIPNIATTRNWITVNIPNLGVNHSIVFIHNNLHPEHYNWLKRFNDLVLVCSTKETAQKVKHIGKAIVLPLSIKVDEVKQYMVDDKTEEIAYIGRDIKMAGTDLPEGIDMITNMPRTKLLPIIAEYRKVYAVGRTAIEAKALNCKVLPFDPRYPNPARWKVLDSLDAAKLLQDKLDKIDKRL